MSALLKLAERCEQATGADRELDAQIWVAVTPDATRRELRGVHKATGKEQVVDETREPGGRLIIVSAYTASLDAAMTLAGEVQGLDFGQKMDDRWECVLSTSVTDAESEAATMPLALCAAGLRARAASCDTQPKAGDVDA